MRHLTSTSGLLALCLGTLAVSPASAHEDDPKILDRKAPVTSQGFRQALPQNGLLQGTSAVLPSFGSTGMITLRAWVPLNQIDGADTGNDCWGYVSPQGLEVAIISTSDGTAFFSLETAGNPVQIGYVPGPNSLWRDVKVWSNYAYIVSEGGGAVQVVDLSNADNGSVSSVGSFGLGTGGSHATHNVAIDETSGFLYRSGGNGLGLRIYDLNQSATNPPLVGEWHTKYVHDVQIVTYTSGPYAGKQVAFCCAGFNNGYTNTGLTILDVTNKNNIVVMGEAFYQDPAYSHQGWLSEDRNWFYLGDELDEDGSLTTRTHVIDVSNLNNPQTQGFFTNGNQAIGHNLYTKDGLIFEANYTSGLRIFDYSVNPTNPPEVAFYDTYPSGDGDSFNGLWSVYPYFPSGLVIGSDLESGLFVWYVGDPKLDIQVVGGAPTAINPAGETLNVTIAEQSAGDLVAGSATLVYDAGAGPISVPLTSVSGNQYTVDFPAIPCGTLVSWYITADSAGGLDWNAPVSAPAAPFVSFSGSGLADLGSFDMESTAGWVAGAAGDNATTGVWERGNPNGTAAQPEDDHSPSGTDCWFTDQGSVGGSIGQADVDNGSTTLLSPLFDLSANPGATISYWRWYVNNGNSAVDDSFVIDISNDGGSSWTNVETLGPGHPEASGGWFQHTLTVSDFVTPTAQVRLRFIASDLGSGSIVEAAIDDLEVAEVSCGGTISTFCDPSVANSTGLPGLMSATGSVVAADNDLTLSASQLPPSQFAYFIAGTESAAGFTPASSMGTLCLGGSLARFNALSQIFSTGGTGTGSVMIDLTNIPTNPAQPVLAGQSWYFQCWYRDFFLASSTSNFTNGSVVSFE